MTEYRTARLLPLVSNSSDLSLAAAWRSGTAGSGAISTSIASSASSASAWVSATTTAIGSPT